MATRSVTADDLGTPVPDRGSGRHRWWEPDRRWLAGSLLIVITPIVVAGFRAVASGYRPVGDDGLLLVRVRDVGTAHTPLLGSWTSASLSGSVNFNNPGPLYFDLVAPAVKVLGPWVGLVIGVMLVNAAAVAVSLVVAERVAGRAGLVAAAMSVAALEWTLGSAVLIDIWQPNALVLPAFAYVVCLWALTSGWRWGLPFVIGLGSLLIQTHVGYTYLVALSGLGAIGLLVWQERVGGRRSGGPWRRPIVTTVVVAGVCWIQPVVEQVTSAGQGNLSRIASASGSGDASLGPALAIRLVGQVLVRPPSWLRSSYADAIPLTWGSTTIDVVGAPAAAIALVALVGGLAALGIVHHRRRDRSTATLTLVAAWMVVAGTISLSVTPGSFVLSPHQMRWLWAVGAFAAMALIVGVGRLRPVPAAWRQGLLAAAGAIAVVFALLNLPSYAPFDYASMNADARPVVARLDEQLASLRGEGPVFIDLSTTVLDDAYSGPLYAILQNHGVDFRVTGEPMVRQLGERRRFDGSARMSIWLVGGSKQPAPEALPPDVRRIALALGIDDDELRELKGLRAELAADPAGVGPADRQRAQDLERRLLRSTVAVYAGPTGQPPPKVTEFVTVGR